jgi:thioredoxin 1
MVKYLFGFFIGTAIMLLSCSNQQQGQTETAVVKLVPKDFSDKITELSDAVIVDVRTPEEFSEGHLSNAKNINWNGSDFQSQMATLDKTKPVMVYCKVGGRSGSAAAYMQANGFKEIYELDGGIMQWNKAHYQVISDTSVTSAKSGMTVKEFEALLQTDKYVLVDFYATWCGPCKQMEPSLNEIAETMADKVIVIRIDVDQNEIISKHFDIESLPTIQIYKNQKLVWDDIGYKTKKQLLKELE